MSTQRCSSIGWTQSNLQPAKLGLQNRYLGQRTLKSEILNKFNSKVEDDQVWVDEAEIKHYEKDNPALFNRDEYLGAYADTHPESTEPYTRYIKELAQNGLKNFGHHKPKEAMSVDRNTLPKQEDIQFLGAQLS